MEDEQMVTVCARHTIQRNRKLHPPGTELTLPLPEAVALIQAGAARGDIAHTDEVAASDPATDAVTRAAGQDAVEDLDVSAPIRELLPRIKDAMSVQTLEAFYDAERARPGGARKSILDAIDARSAMLVAAADGAEGDGEDAADGGDVDLEDARFDDEDGG